MKNRSRTLPAGSNMLLLSGLMIVFVLALSCVNNSSCWGFIESQLEKELDLPSQLYGGLPNFSSNVAYTVMKQGKVDHYMISSKCQLQRVCINELAYNVPFIIYTDRHESWFALNHVACTVKHNAYIYVAYHSDSSTEYLRVYWGSIKGIKSIVKLILRPDNSIELVTSLSSKKYLGFKDPALHSDLEMLTRSKEGTPQIFLYGSNGVLLEPFLMALGGIRHYTGVDVFVECKSKGSE